MLSPLCQRAFPNGGALILAVVVLGVVSALGRAQGSEAEAAWGEALARRFGYLDLASEVFEKLGRSKDPLAKARGLTGQADVARREAARTKAPAERLDFEFEALAKIGAATPEAVGNDALKRSVLFEAVALSQDIASDIEDLVADGLISGPQRERALAEARGALERAAKICDDFERSSAVADDPAHPDWLLVRRARLNRAIVRWRTVRLIGLEPDARGGKEWTQGLDQARRSLEEFILDNEDRYLGMVGYLWLGRVLAEYVAAGAGSVTLDQVEATFAGVPENLIYGPEKAEGGKWAPASDDAQSLAQQAWWWLLEFLNENGRAKRAISRGEAFRAQWQKFGYEKNLFGRLADVEYARALAADGRDADAIAILVEIAAGRNDPARAEAEKAIGKTLGAAADPVRLGATALFAGANGALAQAARDPERYEQAIEILQWTLAALPKEPATPSERELAAEAWYRLGHAYWKVSLRFEAAIAFENAYKVSWAAKLERNPRLAGDAAESWRAALKEEVKAAPSKLAKEALEAADRWILSHPARSIDIAGAADLDFDKAQQEFAAGNWEEARKRFAILAAKDSPRRERAMIKLGVAEMRLLRADKTATPERWLQAVETFEAFRAFARANPVSDPDAVSARARALAEADYSETECLLRAAELATDDPAKKALYERLEAATRGFESRPAGRELQPFFAANRFAALAALGRQDEAVEVYESALAEFGATEALKDLGLRAGKLLRARAEAMPAATDGERAARRAVLARAADGYRRWLLGKRPKKLADWNAVAGLFYELGDWAAVHEILDDAARTFATDADPKARALLDRRLGRAKLELARAAYALGKVDETEKLMKEAATIYDALLGEKDAPMRGYTTVNEEAAFVAGGFLSGPDPKGAFLWYPARGDIERAQNLWFGVLSRLRQTAPEDSEEGRSLEDRTAQARFYLMFFEWKKIESDPAKAGAPAFKKELKALYAKSDGKPGGARWSPFFDWLLSQVP